MIFSYIVDTNEENIGILYISTHFEYSVSGVQRQYFQNLNIKHMGEITKRKIIVGKAI